MNVHRERLVAFTLSGALAGFAGGLLVHLLGSITTEQVYLELTFITLAMLVIGGADEPVGRGRRRAGGERARLVPRRGRGRRGLGGVTLDLPQGTRLIFLGAIMALVLILRPSGITGGREFSVWRRRRRRRRRWRPAAPEGRA